MSDLVQPQSSSEVLASIVSASEQLAGVAKVTPVVTSRTLDQAATARAFLKCENMQNVGAFKFRGAYTAIARLGPAERRAGVLTYSSGNHAQAMAQAGRLLGVPVTVVMPKNAPAVKLAATRGYGAEVITYDPAETTREALAAALPEAKTRTLIPPFDHYDVIAGQGTAAWEMRRQIEAADFLLVPTGGGGLLAGSALAAQACWPSCKVIGVEPELADDAARSFRSGRIETVNNPPTIADGVRTPSLGRRNFPIIRELVHDIVTVSEESIQRAVAFLFFRTKLVVEPAGALGVAALLSHAVDAPGARIAVILSGGNIDGYAMATILARHPDGG